MTRRNRPARRALTVRCFCGYPILCTRNMHAITCAVPIPGAYASAISSTRLFPPLAMKKDIHPAYTKLKVQLANGDTFETRSTMATDLHKSEVDSTNHPFYTGRRQYVDTAGRVEKFRRRYGVKADPEEGEAETA